MTKTNRLVLLGLLILFSLPTQSQTVFGKWKTIDDRTGKPKAIINIYEKNGLMYGNVVKILEEGKEDALCTKCDGELKDKPVLQAMTFRCKIWLNPKNSNELKVRGYLAFIYRTQTWLRIGG